MPNTLTIQSHKGPYTVSSVSNLAADDVQENSLFVIDKNAYSHHASALENLINNRPILLIDATESEKSMVGLTSVLTFLQDKKANKQSQLVAIGGGITQDIACLAAQLFYRGISWVFIPTTLLAMSDSCIGSKSGINFNAYKNQLGVFNPPNKILIWYPFINTLSDDDVLSGFGEMIKLYLIGDMAAFNALQHSTPDDIRALPLETYILKSLQVKKAYIESDEFDLAERQILNFGHTFGHALETVSTYAMPHGLAVVWGIDMANRIALNLGKLSIEMYTNIHQTLHQLFPQISTYNYDIPTLIDAIKKDKKATQDHIKLVLMEAPGKFIFNTQSFSEISALTRQPNQ